ncbi:ribonuclease HII [Stygiolobus caldivivus]|uniref:Ribonuclease HII n=1 Tax=Stygiolobus caldivivus TaxID=2824673 RepID=A0A8D5U4B6_9CREN|nr:ribonuclease HII [Stygiolobus caldivivus]BCU69018.1 ribonuclease HII [Stygiolobus caldivivus]
MILLGIDEAGRGSIIGPMIVAGVIVEDHKADLLAKLGVKDSKKLTRRKREELFKLIAYYSVSVIVVKVLPQDIDRENLNELTYDSVIKIIQLSLPYRPSKITVDKVGKEERVIEFIKEIGSEANVVHNADVLFPECSAASIVAKVIRDKVTDTLKEIYGDFGSGYPGDSKTISWIKSTYSRADKPPPIIRRSWKILQEIAPNYYISKHGH